MAKAARALTEPSEAMDESDTYSNDVVLTDHESDLIDSDCDGSDIGSYTFIDELEVEEARQYELMVELQERHQQQQKQYWWSLAYYFNWISSTSPEIDQDVSAFQSEYVYFFSDLTCPRDLRLHSPPLIFFNQLIS